MTLTGYTLKQAYLFISVAVLLLATFFLFSGGLSLEAKRSNVALWNLGHVIYFALFTLVALKIPFIRRMDVLQQYALVLLATTGIGLTIEMIQYISGRSAEVMDVALDILGSLLVFAFRQTRLSSDYPGYWVMFKSLIVLLGFLSLWPFVSALIDERHAQSQFPVLSDFSSRLEANRWSGYAQAHYVSRIAGVSGVLKINFVAREYAQLKLNYFEPDWSHFQKLRITLYNPEEQPLQITVRANDLKHKHKKSDRFNRRVWVKQGWNTIEILLDDIKTAPKEREMDLKNMVGFSLFTVALQQTRTLYLKSVVLSP